MRATGTVICVTTNPSLVDANGLADLYAQAVAGRPLDNRSLVPLVRSLSIVEPAMVQRRLAQLWSRSIKHASQDLLLDVAIRCCDLTTLEGIDTPARVARLAAKAVLPDGDDLTCPPVAAICVYPDLVAAARDALDRRAGTALAGPLHDRAAGVKIAAVAWGFPGGRTSRDVGIAEIELAVSAGADEIDIVIDRGKVLSGRWAEAIEDVACAKAACGAAHLKVIVESGELGSLEAIGAAAWLSVLGGADFVKTSTGKVPIGATPASVLILSRVAAAAQDTLGRTVGVKASGGIKSAKDALRYLVLLSEEFGPEWLDPTRFRLGVSSLLDDLVAQKRHRRAGIYFDADQFSMP